MKKLLATFSLKHGLSPRQVTISILQTLTQRLWASHIAAFLFKILHVYCTPVFGSFSVCSSKQKSASCRCVITCHLLHQTSVPKTDNFGFLSLWIRKTRKCRHPQLWKIRNFVPSRKYFTHAKFISYMFCIVMIFQHVLVRNRPSQSNLQRHLIIDWKISKTRSFWHLESSRRVNGSRKILFYIENHTRNREIDQNWCSR